MDDLSIDTAVHHGKRKSTVRGAEPALMARESKFLQATLSSRRV
jgi:hypothetical protein